MLEEVKTVERVEKVETVERVEKVERFVVVEKVKRRVAFLQRPMYIDPRKTRSTRKEILDSTNQMQACRFHLIHIIQPRHSGTDWNPVHFLLSTHQPSQLSATFLSAPSVQSALYLVPSPLHNFSFRAFPWLKSLTPTPCSGHCP